MIAAADARTEPVRTAWIAATVAVLLIETASCAVVARSQEPVMLPDAPQFAPDIDVTEVNWSSPRFPAPLWTSYALTDALFWGRDNQATNQPLIVSESTGAALVSARDLQFPFSPGVRAFYGQRSPDRGGWELGYFGIYGQSATQVVAATPPDFLQVPDPLGGAIIVEGEQATVKYNSVINSAELNLFTTSTEWRDHTASWLTVDWLLGFRYLGVEEQAALLVECCAHDGGLVTVPYGVRTRNNLFGAQVGNRSRWTWQNWAFEGWAKAGLFGNAQQQIQDPLFDLYGVPVRDGISKTGGQVAFVGDINTSVIYRLTEVWGIRAGYNLIWIDGLALAPNQFDFSNDGSSGSRLVSGGGIFMHGANLGLEARW